MSLLNKQQVFDKIWQYFIVEKHPQSGNLFGCYYRSKEGNKCAIGCLIPDEMYLPEFDSQEASTAVDDLMTSSPIFKKTLEQIIDFKEDAMLIFLNSMQTCHDVYFEKLEESLRDAAFIYDLSVPTA